MKLASLKIDSARIERGDWVGQIPGMGDLELKVRGFGNSDYQRIIAREQQVIGRDKRINGRIDPVTLDGIMAKTILLDWRGLTGADDQPEPYTKELATKLLTDPDFRPFQEAVSWAANVVQDARAKRTKEAVGNSASA